MAYQSPYHSQYKSNLVRVDRGGADLRTFVWWLPTSHSDDNDHHTAAISNCWSTKYPLVYCLYMTHKKSRKRIRSIYLILDRSSLCSKRRHNNQRTNPAQLISHLASHPPRTAPIIIMRTRIVYTTVVSISALRSDLIISIYGRVLYQMWAQWRKHDDTRHFAIPYILFTTGDRRAINILWNLTRVQVIYDAERRVQGGGSRNLYITTHDKTAHQWC